MPAQLPLDIRLRADATFERFLPGANGELVRQLQALAAPAAVHRLLLLWGEAGSGRTHLLQSVCHAAGERSVYLPLAELADAGPEVIEGLGTLPLVLLDDLPAVLAVSAWQEALFRLFNAVRDHAGTLLIAADQPPRGLAVGLPDLATRLSQGVVLELRALDGDANLALFLQRAGERGLEVSEEVAAFFMRRAPRDTRGVLELLEQIDRAALAAQRRLTVPFLKEILGW